MSIKESGRLPNARSPRAGYRARLVGSLCLTVATVILLVVSGVTAAASCYEDVIVSGAGRSEVNGTYGYAGEVADRPMFEKADGCVVVYFTASSAWYILWNNPPDLATAYMNNADSLTPPLSGWYVAFYGLAPAPTLSGGASTDTAPPDLSLPPDVTIACDASSHPDDTGWATATDGCDPDPEVTYSDANGFGAAGVILRTWRAEDASGNASQAVQRISITCPDITVTGIFPEWVSEAVTAVTLSFTAAKCADEASLYVPGVGWSDWMAIVSDGSTENAVSLGIPAGQPDGSYNVTILLLRNAASGRYMVHNPVGWSFAVDRTPPTFAGCPGNLSVDAWPGEASAVVTWTEPMATDALSGLASLSASHLPGTGFPVGTTTVSYTAADVAGNVAQCSFDVSVNATRAVVTPSGASGLLHRGWPEGVEPPLVGELYVAAVYEIGEPIDGCFTLRTPTGEPIEERAVLTLYAVLEIGEFFDLRAPLDARFVAYSRETCMHCFAIDSRDLTPGYYDLRLGFPDNTVEWLRVELVPPSGPE